MDRKPNDKIIIFRLDNDLHKRIKSFSGLTGRSMSQYIRDILEVNHNPFLLKNKESENVQPI